MTLPQTPVADEAGRGSLALVEHRSRQIQPPCGRQSSRVERGVVRSPASPRSPWSTAAAPIEVLPPHHPDRQPVSPDRAAMQ